ncbi:hypothetical protein [Sphingomonas sp. MMS24-J13]|uniref:hypothetical protein n=1 Tax=Sphingomonas sp. MMS24-J13 TaxID=3238686 RepID=UPI00384A7749
MSKRPALALLLLLSACHRGKVADVTLDADRAAENATAAKTLADLAAADQAAATPLPARRTAAPAPAHADGDQDRAAADETPPIEGNGGDTAPR